MGALAKHRDPAPAPTPGTAPGPGIERAAGTLTALLALLGSLWSPAPAAACEPASGPAAASPGSPAAVAAVVPRPDTTWTTVEVSADGTAEVDPDRVVLRFAVETEADSAGAAVAANAERMTALRRALGELGIPPEGFRTSGYSLQPEYARPREGVDERRIVGYRVANRLQVTVDSAGRAGEVIDAGVAAGANRLDGLSFESSRSEEARLSALAAAVEAARLRAEAIARAAGRRLGPLLRVTAGGGGGGPVLRYEMAAARADTPIEPGRLTVTESVTAVWRLEPAP